MKKGASAVRWTYQDYRLFPDDGKRHEIIEGERFVTPAPTPRHQLISGRLEFALRSFVRRAVSGGRASGEVLHAPIDVHLSDVSVVQPDIIFVRVERLAIIGERELCEAPDLVVEILSESTRRTDYGPKRKLYAAHGVREYWIVDPEIDRVEIFLLEEGDLVKKLEITAGAASSPLVLPGFEVDVAGLFAPLG